MQKLSKEEIQDRLKDLDGWEYEEDSLYTSLKFNNFKEAFVMMTGIAFEAEAMQHHPNWYNSYNILEIRLQTHEADGVTAKDFKLAGIINGLLGEES